MTAVAPLVWDRVEIDTDTGESIGRCNSDWFGAFIWPLAFIMFVPTVLTGFMAWKTVDVDASYSDAFWVGVLILVQLEVRSSIGPFLPASANTDDSGSRFLPQVIVLGIPVVFILRDVNTNGRYFGIVLLLWTFPASAMSLIILPKVMAYRRFINGNNKRRKSRGPGATVQVHVSGLASDTLTGGGEIRNAEAN